jgi:hypothetical protein
MQCKLCDRTIPGFDPKTHRLLLDDDREVAVCEPCALRLTDWLGERMARLFPTKTMKKRYGRRGGS